MRSPVFSWIEKNTLFYNFFWVKSLSVGHNPESSRTIFMLKKNEKLRAKNTFPVYGWASKSLKNHAFFMQNHRHVLLEKSLLLSFPGIQTEQKSNKKSFIFNVKILLFYLQNRYFHRSRYVDAVKKRARSFHFSLKIHHFLYKNHRFLKEKSMFSHISI